MSIGWRKFLNLLNKRKKSEFFGDMRSYFFELGIKCPRFRSNIKSSPLTNLSARKGDFADPQYKVLALSLSRCKEGLDLRRLRSGLLEKLERKRPV